MPFNMVMVKFVKAMTRLLAYSLTNISPSETCKLDVQVTNFKTANKIYLYHFYFLVYNICFFNA